MFTRKNLIVSFGLILLFVIYSILVIYHYLVQIDNNNYNNIIEKQTSTTTGEKSTELLNEQDISSYTAFTFDKLYSPESDIYKRNIIKLKGLKQKNLHLIIQNGLNYLNSSFKFNDFLIGFYKHYDLNDNNNNNNNNNYNEYDLYYKYENKCCSVVKLKQPIQTTQLVSVHNINTKKQINFILPLTSSKINKLYLFLNNFNSINDNYISLTIVFNSFIKFNSKIDLILKKYKNLKIKLIYTKNIFSRANYLELATDYHANNDLLFFCDIDIIFTQLFLDLCRQNTELNSKVYFPILYSFYNPKLNENQTDSNKDSKGYWRYTGYGMVCLYKQDFKSINGFDVFNLKTTWGGEDIYLFRKFINSKINVIRSVAPGLFHLYHFKECENNLTENNKDCWNSKIMNEASLKTFGLIYFKNKKFN